MREFVRVRVCPVQDTHCYYVEKLHFTQGGEDSQDASRCSCTCCSCMHHVAGLSLKNEPCDYRTTQGVFVERNLQRSGIL